MRSHSYLNTAKLILENYDGSIPLSPWLKNFYSSNKKYGSKDRKIISELCFSYFRKGGLFQSWTIEEQLLTGLFLTSTSQNIIINELRPEWVDLLNIEVKEKLSIVCPDCSINSVLPFNNKLSKEIEVEKFNESFLIQPDVFIRIRPGKYEDVIRQLNNAPGLFKEITSSCIRLPNSSSIDKLISIDEDAVIQDLNSQKVFNSTKSIIDNNKSLKVWDTCAASGGKSILFKDLYPKAQLTVSDVRRTILINLQNRFRRAHIDSYHSFEADLTLENNLPAKDFDFIICDVPCSGSGTWSRSPEQVTYFNDQKLDHYNRLQRSIALNSSKKLNKDGNFLYITCSVFASENEEMVNYLINNTSLQLISFNYYKGYKEKADTLFTALFKA
ncbi:MAG: Fmu (Sun) domain-containing protein [Flavisolibacter sp.]